MPMTKNKADTLNIIISLIPRSTRGVRLRIITISVTGNTENSASFIFPKSNLFISLRGLMIYLYICVFPLTVYNSRGERMY